KRMTSPESVTVSTVAKNLKVPWDMVLTPDHSRIIFTERPGSVKSINLEKNNSVKTLFHRKKVLHWGEGGLMGLALHPEWEKGPKHQWIYLCETYGNYGSAQNQIVRVRRRTGDTHGFQVEPLIEGMPAASYHDGCRLAFGPDNNLYATMGDAGQPSRAQNLQSYAGKILRLTPSGEPAPNNPFTDGRGDNASVRDYVYSLGHRNPQGLAWHPETGQLYSSEHGPSGEFGLGGNDEINVIHPENNYGWPKIVGAPGITPYKDPLMLFPEPHLPPAGMDFHRWKSGTDYSLYVGSLRGELLLKANINQDDRDPRVTNIERWFEHSFFNGVYGRIRAVLGDKKGRLYIATSNRDGRGDPANNDDRILVLTRESAEQ
ncbi:MAG: sorbosone dehydrogenase family protein, partial [bacterium]